MERREIQHAGVLWESKKAGDHEKLLDVVGKITLGRIFRNRMGCWRLDYSGSGEGTSGEILLTR
jgi:hypothetical protein